MRRVPPSSEQSEYTVQSHCPLARPAGRGLLPQLPQFRSGTGSVIPVRTLSLHSLLLVCFLKRLILEMSFVACPISLWIPSQVCVKHALCEVVPFWAGRGSLSGRVCRRLCGRLGLLFVCHVAQC